MLLIAVQICEIPSTMSAVVSAEMDGHALKLMLATKKNTQVRLFMPQDFKVQMNNHLKLQILTIMRYLAASCGCSDELFELPSLSPHKGTLCGDSERFHRNLFIH